MSRHSVIEAFVDAKLREIDGLSVKLVAPGFLGSIRPDTFPGITHALDESPLATDEPQNPRAHGRRYWRKRVVTGWVLIHGTDDAAQTGEARYNAWAWFDAVERALSGKRPLKAGMPAADSIESDTDLWYIIVRTPEPFISDAGLFGVAVPWDIAYANEFNRENEPS